MATRLDRFSRSVKHLLEVSADLEARGVGLKCIEQPLDTTSSMGKFIFTILGAVAELERQIIIERTRTGLAAARARGHVGGRAKTYTAQQCQAARMLRDQGTMTAVQIAETLGFSRPTYFRALKDFLDTEPTSA